MKDLSEYSVSVASFKDQQKIFEEFRSQKFQALGSRQRELQVNRALVQLIQSAEEKAFLLIPVLGFIDKVNQEGICEGYNLSSFELWMNQFSELTPAENYQIRGKIVGKFIPRDEYQVFFPIGMGKHYPGSHYVTAHSSPDLDTTIASFWGWMDAFGAQVGEGLHLWNVPGGPPLSQVEIDLLFIKIFGDGVFTHLAKTRSSLGLSSIELMNQKGVIKKQIQESTLEIDHERMQKAVIIVDDEGYYLGDWRNFDVEGVRQIVMLLNQCMRWFENHLHVRLISLFAKESLSKNELPELLQSIFSTSFRACQPVREFTEKQRQYLHVYLSKVLGIEEGLDATFETFSVGMKKCGVSTFYEFINLSSAPEMENLFTESGALAENRPLIFHYLEKMILSLDKAIASVRVYEERLDVALNIKMRVFGYEPQVVSYRDEVEEIRSKIDSYPYLTVTAADQEGRLTAMGVIHATDIYKNILGTVSLRDFCNREETKIPSYFEVISVIDHHKSVLSTLSAPLAFITDSQSSNALIAELSFIINDSYSTGGMSLKQIESQMEKASRDLSKPCNKRIMQKLLQRHLVHEKKSQYYVTPEREYVEYLHFLYAILDDTDLLTKVTRRDVECVVSLLNRLKSLSIQEEVEIVFFDDLPRDVNYTTALAQRILQNKEMYALYQKTYVAKERSVEENLQLCIQGKPSSIFVDTKEQNGCCRIGQTKMFSRNFSLYQKLRAQVRRQWFEESVLSFKENPEVDLYMHMISTIAGAEDVFAGNAGKYSHKDELWIWIPETESGVEHLKSFLNAFKGCPAVLHHHFEAEFLGKNARKLEQIFKESFSHIPMKVSPQEDLPIVVLYYNAGILNSRKAMISPFLPHLVS
ncbi:MAG: hypothetical protein V4494_05150 [Chlamydiota bacterium]